MTWKTNPVAKSAVVRRAAVPVTVTLRVKFETQSIFFTSACHFHKLRFTNGKIQTMILLVQGSTIQPQSSRGLPALFRAQEEMHNRSYPAFTLHRQRIHRLPLRIHPRWNL